MDLTSLQAFVSVAETTSFSTAAEQLFLTQPAVSIAARRGGKMAKEKSWKLLAG